jgi:adenylyltransferase/sulfurtransferase
VANRYVSQITLPQIGEQGQEKLGNSYVVLIGCGAIGTVIASSLARAGFGKIKVVDKDSVEYQDLTRHALFTEDDVKSQLPKAIATARHLRRINSSIDVTGILADVNQSNIEQLISGADLVVAGLNDNETCFLINDACLKHKIPWVHGKAVGTWGTILNIIPGQTPCYQCAFGSPLTHERIYTTENVGLFSGASFIIGCLQFVEAVKILTGAEQINHDLLTVDIWKGTFHRLKVRHRSGCLACAGKFEFLSGRSQAKATRPCDGGRAVEVLSPVVRSISLSELALRLSPLGEVKYNEFMLRFNTDSHEIVIFPDGRAIFKNMSDESLALKLYAQYIGG